MMRGKMVRCDEAMTKCVCPHKGEHQHTNACQVFCAYKVWKVCTEVKVNKEKEATR